MAWGDPTSLKFDVAEISSMRKQIQATSADLAKFKTELLEEIKILKENWKTPAGKKFTKEVNTDWASQIDKYITIIDAVDELLEVAEKNYREVETDVTKISF